MKIMSIQLAVQCRNLISAVKFFNGARLQFIPCHFRNLGNSSVQKSLFLAPQNCFITSKTENWRPLYNNGGFPRVSTTLKSNFHTSKSCQAIGPFFYALFKPLVNIFGVIAGRKLKSWWVSLPPNKKKEILEGVKAHSKILLVGSAALAASCFGFYFIHLTEAPITKRKRFIVYSKKKLLQISEIQNNLLQKIHDVKILPANSILYMKIEKIIKAILEKNQDIPEIRNVPWSVYVISDPLQKNVFVLPDGSIYVFSGIFDVCKNDDQLAFVLAHEISHVIMSHVEENISRGYFMEMLVLIPILLFWATMPGEWAVISHWITNRMNHIMITLPFCRSTEMEADYVALQLIAKACFDVREASKFWHNMLKNSIKDYPTPPVEWLSTHPHYSKREKLLNEFMPAAIRIRESHKCPPLKDDKDTK